MSLILEVSPQVEAQIIEIARQEGVAPGKLVEKWVNAYKPTPSAIDGGELGGKTIGQLYGHLLGTLNFEPNDVAANTKHYLKTTGFGETVERRKLAE